MREVQIKTAPTEVAKVQKTDNTKCRISLESNWKSQSLLVKGEMIPHV